MGDGQQSDQLKERLTLDQEEHQEEAVSSLHGNVVEPQLVEADYELDYYELLEHEAETRQGDYTVLDSHPEEQT